MNTLLDTTSIAKIDQKVAKFNELQLDAVETVEVTPLHTVKSHLVAEFEPNAANSTSIPSDFTIQTSSSFDTILPAKRKRVKTMKLLDMESESNSKSSTSSNLSGSNFASISKISNNIDLPNNVVDSNTIIGLPHAKDDIESMVKKDSMINNFFNHVDEGYNSSTSVSTSTSTSNFDTTSTSTSPDNLESPKRKRGRPRNPEDTTSILQTSTVSSETATSPRIFDFSTSLSSQQSVNIEKNVSDSFASSTVNTEEAIESKLESNSKRPQRVVATTSNSNSTTLEVSNTSPNLTAEAYYWSNQSNTLVPLPQLDSIPPVGTELFIFHVGSYLGSISPSNHKLRHEFIRNQRCVRYCDYDFNEIQKKSPVRLREHYVNCTHRRLFFNNIDDPIGRLCDLQLKALRAESRAKEVEKFGKKSTEKQMIIEVPPIEDSSRPLPSLSPINLTPSILFPNQTDLLHLVPTSNISSKNNRLPYTLPPNFTLFPHHLIEQLSVPEINKNYGISSRRAIVPIFKFIHPQPHFSMKCQLCKTMIYEDNSKVLEHIMTCETLLSRPSTHQVITIMYFSGVELSDIDRSLGFTPFLLELEDFSTIEDFEELMKTILMKEKFGDRLEGSPSKRLLNDSVSTNNKKQKSNSTSTTPQDSIPPFPTLENPLFNLLNNEDRTINGVFSSRASSVSASEVEEEILEEEEIKIKEKGRKPRVRKLPPLSTLVRRKVIVKKRVKTEVVEQDPPNFEVIIEDEPSIVPILTTKDDSDDYPFQIRPRSIQHSSLKSKTFSSYIFAIPPEIKSSEGTQVVITLYSKKYLMDISDEVYELSEGLRGARVKKDLSVAWELEPVLKESTGMEMAV